MSSCGFFFFKKSFIVFFSHLDFKSIGIDFFCMIRDLRVRRPFYSMWRSSYTSTIYWKDCNSGSPFHKPGDYMFMYSELSILLYGSVVYPSTDTTLSRLLHLYNRSWFLVVWFFLFLLLKVAFASLHPLHFYTIVRISLSILQKFWLRFCLELLVICM